MTETTTPPEAVTEEAATGPLTPLQLSVGDIENAVKVIDFACEQGAFKGWQVVGEVMGIRNRLVTFLRSVQVPVSGDENSENGLDVPESPGAE